MPNIKPIQNFITAAAKMAPKTSGVVTAPNIGNALNGIAGNAGLSIVEQKIRTLFSHFKTESIKFSVNGKEIEGIKFVGSQNGSNTGYWVASKNLKNLVYMKTPGAQQAYNEKIASSLYKLGGIETTDSSIVKLMDVKIPEYANSKETMDITTAFASQFLPIERNAGLYDAQMLRKGFGMDCWLANWDALKTGNVVISNGKAVRLDVGGSLLYRARGGRKGAAFGENVGELTSFFDHSKSLSLPYLKDMSRNELIDSLSRVVKISKNDIEKIVNENSYVRKTSWRTDEVYDAIENFSSPEFLKETLLARQNYIKAFLQECLRTPQSTGESIEAYIRRVDCKVPKKKYTLDFEKILMSKEVREGECLNMAECLTPSQKQAYEEAYKAYQRSKNNLCAVPRESGITTNTMLHSADITSFDSIISDGITSGDFRGAIGAGTGEPTKTPLCADFWDVKKNYSIKEYFARPRFESGEENFLPSTSYAAISHPNSIVYVINKKRVNPEIMDKSFNVMDRNTLFHKDNNMGGHDYPTHRAVPIGVPANAIEKIIVGPKYAGKPTLIEGMAKKMKDKGLRVSIYDLNGKLLYDAAKVGAGKLVCAYKFCLWGKRGLPLQYPREAFIRDINKALEHLPKAEQDRILAKFNMKRSAFDIEGFPNFAGITGSITKPEEIKLAQLINKFNTNNPIQIENPQMQEWLNSVIDRMPEFRMIVGKQQHGTHAYSVDIHTLNVLQKIMNNPSYNTLSDDGKKVLEYATLMHDFGKFGSQVTTGHASISKQYAEQILSRSGLSLEVKQRILNLIENHHWFEGYNKGITTARDFCRTFPNSEDRIIAKIFAKADFESVNESFHRERLMSGQVLTPEQYEKIFEEKMRMIF